MKKIILIIFSSLMFANIGFAEGRLIEEVQLGPNSNNKYYFPSTACIDGYKFVLYSSMMVQFFEERDGKSLPAKC